LNKEPLARLLANVPFFADQTTVGEWLRAQSPASIAGVWEVVQEFVRWVMQVKTLFHKIMLMPARLVKHARVIVARIMVPAERLAWWVQTMSRLWPQPRVGRPCG
jgi:hypothetical protein